MVVAAVVVVLVVAIGVQAVLTGQGRELACLLHCDMPSVAGLAFSTTSLRLPRMAWQVTATTQGKPGGFWILTSSRSLEMQADCHCRLCSRGYYERVELHTEIAGSSPW